MYLTRVAYRYSGTDMNRYSFRKEPVFTRFVARECVLAKLPPCEESLKQHVRRAAWQTWIWISYHIAKPDLGSLLEYGWKREGEKLVPVYYEGLSASEVMQDLLCTCSKRNLCGTDTCSCRKNRLACVELCSCHGDDVCQNPNSTQDTSDSDSE